MVVSEGAINNIMGGMENTAGVRLHSHRHKLKQRFDIIKKLGQGTYGKVQLAINKETGKEVAIKTIKKGKIETEQDLIRIRREIQIMSSVQHPQIIHIYEVFENRDKMVLVMEYAAGGELYDYLSERKVLQEDEARRVFRQVSSAVYYCHTHKICHRDLKLENILLDLDGNAKIADFGLSNVFDEKHRLDTFCGSPLYASPEIVKGIPYLGPEVDCWSLGVLLYTLVYGAMPFDGSSFRRLVKQITQGDFYEPATPASASELIRHMLAVKTSERATIQNICSHWWVNEGFESSCLKEAEFFANQTPVRLDLLLSLAPKDIDSEHMVIQAEESTSDSKKSKENWNIDNSLPTDQPLTVNVDGATALRSHSTGAMPPTTSGSMDRLVKKKMRRKAGDSSREDSVAPEKKKKKKETSKKSLLKKDENSKKKSVESGEEAEVIRSKNSREWEEETDFTKKKEDMKVVKEKKKTKKRDSGEVKAEKKKAKKSTESVTNKSPALPTTKPLAGSSITKLGFIEPDAASLEVSIPEYKILHEEQFEEEVTEAGRIFTEPLSPVEVKSPIADSADTEKILLETAAKIEAVEAAIKSERISTMKESNSKTESLVGSPSSNKSSIPSSLVTSPTRSRTGSESSGDRPSSSRRHSKIFSKAAMFDNLAAQNNSRSPPPEKPKRIHKPGSLNLTDLTKRFEEKSSIERKTKIISPVKVSDAKRTFESKADKNTTFTTGSRTSISSGSQPASPPSKLNSPESLNRGDIIQPKDDNEQMKSEYSNPKNEIKICTEIVTSKQKQSSPIKSVSELSSISKTNENMQPCRQLRSKLSPNKREVSKAQQSEDVSTIASRPEIQTITAQEIESRTKIGQEKISYTKISPANSASKVRQMKIQLESSDSSDSESEAEKMLRTLTEKREKLEQFKAEKLKMATESKDRCPQRDMPVIKEEPRTPTPARHVIPTEAMLDNDTKCSTLPRGFKSKEQEILFPKKLVTVSPSNSNSDNARKKTQMQITLNNSKPILTTSDSYGRQSSSRSSPEYRTEVIHNLGEAAYTPTEDTHFNRREPHLQRARRERIIPIMLEDDDNFSQGAPTSRTSSSVSVPMYKASTRVTSSMPQQTQHISRETIQKSRRERIIPISVEGEGILTPPVAESAENNLRRPMHPTINSSFGCGRGFIDRSDSFSSAGEDDDDDDGFQILTAESLFSTLLSRVRSLTRKMADDPRNLRRTAVGEPGAFWSSLHTPIVDSPGSRRVSDNLSREDGFGIWNRNLSREPSDADSVFSEPTSLHGGWRSRRNGKETCRLNDSGQTQRRLIYSRTLSKEFPKNYDIHSRTRTGDNSSVPTLSSNLVSPLPNFDSYHIDKNTPSYATLRKATGLRNRRPHSIVNSSQKPNDDHGMINEHRKIPDTKCNSSVKNENNINGIVEKRGIPQSRIVSYSVSPTNINSDVRQTNLVLNTVEIPTASPGLEKLNNEQKSKLITENEGKTTFTEQMHINEGSTKQIQLVEKLKHSPQKLTSQKRKETDFKRISNTSKDQQSTSVTNISCITPSQFRLSNTSEKEIHSNIKKYDKTSATEKCHLDSISNSSKMLLPVEQTRKESPSDLSTAINSRNDNRSRGAVKPYQKAKTRDIIPVIEAAKDKINQINSNPLRKIYPFQAYRKSKTSELSIPTDIDKKNGISIDRIERSKSPYERAKFFIENKLDESPFCTHNAINNNSKFNQGIDESSSPQPTLTLNASEIWQNDQILIEKPKDMDKSKSMYKIITSKIHRSLSNVGEKQFKDIKNNEEKVTKDDKITFIHPSRFLRGKAEKSLSRVSLAGEVFSKAEEGIQSAEKKPSKRLSDALNRLLGWRSDDTSEHRSGSKNTKIKHNSKQNEHNTHNGSYVKNISNNKSNMINDETENIFNHKKTGHLKETNSVNNYEKILINDGETVSQYKEINKNDAIIGKDSHICKKESVSEDKDASVNNDDESVIDRITRKSYYSRFNESKKKPISSRIDSRESMDKQLAEAKARLFLNEIEPKKYIRESISPTQEMSNEHLISSSVSKRERKRNGPRTISPPPEAPCAYKTSSISHEQLINLENWGPTTNLKNTLTPPEKLSFYRQPQVGVNERAYFKVAVRPPKPHASNRMSVSDIGERMIINSNNTYYDRYKASQTDNILDEPKLYTERSSYNTLPNRHRTTKIEELPVMSSFNILVNNLILKNKENKPALDSFHQKEICKALPNIDDKYKNLNHPKPIRNDSCTSVDQIKSSKNYLNELHSTNNEEIQTSSQNILTAREDIKRRLTPLSARPDIEPRNKDYRRAKTTSKLVDLSSINKGDQKCIERLPYRRTTTNVDLPIQPRPGDFRWILSSPSNRTINRTSESEPILEEGKS